MPTHSLRNGTYLREPDGAELIYFSPYSFNDATENFRKRYLYDDSWHRVVSPTEENDLWKLVKLQPGEYVHVFGGQITS
jgi:hypothetical protein